MNIGIASWVRAHRRMGSGAAVRAVPSTSANVRAAAMESVRSSATGMRASVNRACCFSIDVWCGMEPGRSAAAEVPAAVEGRRRRPERGSRGRRVRHWPGATIRVSPRKRSRVVASAPESGVAPSAREFTHTISAVKRPGRGIWSESVRRGGMQAGRKPLCIAPQLLGVRRQRVSQLRLASKLLRRHRS